MNRGLFYTIHPASRFLLGLALLSLATATSAVAYGVLLVLLSALFLRTVDAGWSRVIRTLGLLRWFVIPILILHACFSPGRFIFPGVPLPLTWEGITQGLYLSVHLAAIFFTATALFLCLNRREWFKAILNLPVINRELAVYVVMIAPLRGSVGCMLQLLRQKWQLRKGWIEFPLILVSAFRSTLAVAAEHSRQLWLRWPVHPLLDGPLPASSSLIVNLLCATVGGLGVVMAWQI